MGIPHVNSDILNNLICPLPPLPEQQTIANCLDRKTHQIDTLIEKKQKLIDLHKEQRTALINQAVTRGLNPNVKLKDLGIEWLGEIPEHWEVRKLKYFSEIVNGSTPKSGIREYWDGDIVWLTPDDLGKLNGKRINDSTRKITEQGLNSCGTTITPPNSIILSTRAPIGHIGISNNPSCTNQGCKTIIPDFELCDFNYVYYLLYGQKEELQSLGHGSTFTELSSQKLKDLKIPFPPISEQKHIAKHLDQKSKVVDGLIEKHKKSIELLKEYRTALISEVVTGKIDVREEGVS
jgi:type I restriction enzyme S subunit